MNTDDVVRELQQLKSDARDRRQQGDVDNEVGRLQAGVVRGRAALAENPPAAAGGTDSPLIREVADCLGMLGGALLRHGKVREAIDVFQEGRDLEMSHPEAVNFTYNTVNWFVARLLNGGWRTLDDARRELTTVIAHLKALATSSAAGDVWTWADLGMCEFLSGAYSDARSSYAKAAGLATADERRSILGRLLMIEEKRLPLSPEQAALLNDVKQVLI